MLIGIDTLVLFIVAGLVAVVMLVLTR